MPGNFKDFSLGDLVEVSTESQGRLSDMSWRAGNKTHQARVVGFDAAGHPVLCVEDPVKGIINSRQLGAWEVNSKAQALNIGVDQKYADTIPLDTACLFMVFEPTAIKNAQVKSPSVKTGTVMKHGLKVGDKIVIGLNTNSSIPINNAWNTTTTPLEATVVGAHVNGAPVLKFDKPNYSFMWSWKYNYGNDLSMIDPVYRTMFSNIEQNMWVMSDTTMFLRADEYKAGKRPVSNSLPFQTMCDALGINKQYDDSLLDSKEFMKHIANCLPDESESHLFGEQFLSLMNKEVPEKHSVFLSSKKKGTDFIHALRNYFSESSIVNNGIVKTDNADFIVEEYLIKWRHTSSIQKNFKLQINRPTVDGAAKSVFEKGGVDVSAFQLFRAGHLVKNFVNTDFNAALESAMKKEFTTFGNANKAAIEELIKKGFKSKGKIKESKKTMNNSNGNVPSFAQMMKEDFNKASYRVAADQITHGLKQGIVAMLGSKGGTASQLEGMKMLLDSEIGEAAIAMLAGFGLTYAPMVNADPRAQKLAGEFRVNGMAKAGNVLVETMIGSFLPIVQSALASLPAEEATQLRVAETNTNKVLSDAEREAAEEEANAAPVEGKKAVA